MKIMISFLSLVVIFLGIFPLIKSFPLHLENRGYAILILVFGILLLLASFLNNLLMGLERMFLILQSALLVFIALVHFFPTWLPFSLEGIYMYLAVMFIGAIGLLYGIPGQG